MKSRVVLLTLVCVSLLFTIPASAKDTWISVRSKNFHLVGNANEKEIRQVATKLEQFRETFRQIFPRVKLSQSIQTNVIVFKDDGAYRPFKPKNASGKTIGSIAGYFQPGTDVNYITLAIDADMKDTYGIIFHKYVHFILEANFGKSEVPAWFNEGLAEYYQTFKIENDQKVTLGIIQPNHLYFLQQSKLMPLKSFFEIDNYSLHQSGSHSRSIFYAQAWALIHYLLQGVKGGNADGLNNFLTLVMKGAKPEDAFQQAFLMDYPAMEKALTNYVAQSKYYSSVLSFKQKLIFDTEMKTAPLSEAESNAFLGDLLFHTNSLADAEIYLQKAIALDPKSSMANTSLGLIRTRERKFEEAKAFLEKAIAGDARNHFAHYNYAYVLSREGMDEFGFVQKYAPDSVKRMRDSLVKAIELNPAFTESYQLLSFLYLVNNENLEEAIVLLKKAADLQPGNQQNQYLLAQLYLRQEKVAEASALAEKIFRTADEPDLRAKAQALINNIREYQEKRAFFDKQTKELEDRGIKAPILVKRKGEKPLTEEEVERIKRENEIISLNSAVKRPEAGQTEAVGYLDRVACVRGEVVYTFRSETESFTLTSKGFGELDLMAMVEEAQNLSFGCDADVKAMKAVVIYEPAKVANAKSRGTLRALTFVPQYFERKTEEELKNARQTVIVEDPRDDPNAQAEFEKKRREMMLENIRNNLRKPAEGETRVFGVVERIECSGGAMYFVAKVDDATLKLKARSPQIRSFSAEASGLQFGCGVKMPQLRAYIIFRGSILDAGELVSVEFVPPSFKPEE
ncbi:MAG: tetratricopeptide repeat protein [Acidobacteria bacterium]|nr:tetratricopeptide repeat protein [Acidobacteriota bacterium]